MKKYKYLIIILFLLITPFLCGQSKTNLNIFKELVDSSVTSFINNLPKNENHINLKMELGTSYSFFQNRILNDLIKKGIKVSVYPSLKEKEIGRASCRERV